MIGQGVREHAKEMLKVAAETATSEATQKQKRALRPARHARDRSAERTRRWVGEPSFFRRGGGSYPAGSAHT